MKVKLLIFACVLSTHPTYADVLGLDVSLYNVRNNCSGISDELAPMKKLAGINTAITGIGTLAGGGATITGFVKASKDKDAEKIEIRLEELRKIEQSNPASSELTQSEIDNFTNSFDAYAETAKAELQKMQEELDRLNKQSKNLGNWRTGLMAGSTATSVAGAIIASQNKVDKDLQTMVNDCKSSVDDLRRSVMQARMDGLDVSFAQNIISACSGYDTLDVSKINKRADGAKWSAIAGAAVGATGTVTSAMANTDKTRSDNSDSGKSRETNLNTASNILAIGATIASGTSTVFNATQISAIKRAATVSDRCQEALR